MSGRFTGEEIIFILSFSPLFRFISFRFISDCFVSFHVGENTHVGVVKNTLVLPLWTVFWGVFGNDHFEVWALGHSHDDTVAGAGGNHPYYMYIYSLGHFLTTKGALIDGDAYPPKMPKNDPKMTPKMTNFSLNLRSKNDQKWRFLMGKSSFSSKWHKLTQKVTKNDQKSTHIYDTKMRLNLTTKWGIVGVQVC